MIALLNLKHKIVTHTYIPTDKLITMKVDFLMDGNTNEQILNVGV